MGVYPDDIPIIPGARELVAVAPGIPFGITFLGKKWSEETLITLAYAYEQATQHRDALVPRPDAVLPKTELTDIVGGGSPSSPTGTPNPSAAVSAEPGKNRSVGTDDQRRWVA
ncbi:hypothetical protein VTK73DRAFT_7576 [Phialemonium thermophilum]|uniref:Amidase n=1 Tax=Phialemonium thermophilum TaxID=223376 RepID=A0ABR3WDS9_9PEZI